MKSNKTIPPRLAQRLLLRFLRNDLAEEVLGDLDEKFYTLLKSKSPLRAKLNYWFQGFNYMRPFAVSKSKSAHLNHYVMFQSYFKIGWRNLLKNKLFSVINISGMAISIASFLIISFFVYDEFRFDKHIENARLKYRVYGKYFTDDGRIS